MLPEHKNARVRSSPRTKTVGTHSYKVLFTSLCYYIMTHECTSLECTCILLYIQAYKLHMLPWRILRVQCSLPVGPKLPISFFPTVFKPCSVWQLTIWTTINGSWCINEHTPRWIIVSKLTCVLTVMEVQIMLLYRQESIPSPSLQPSESSCYIVFESALLLLFSVCRNCLSKAVEITKTTQGSLLRIKQTCTHCHYK